MWFNANNDLLSCTRNSESVALKLNSWQNGNYGNTILKIVFAVIWLVINVNGTNNFINLLTII